MFDYSFDRLLRLAKKTGDRLIVHDEMMGDDVVIMNIDQYENLWDQAQIKKDQSEVRELSERGLIDKINRDIAIWRANQEMEEDLCDGLCDEEDDYFSEDDGVEDSWKSVGDVLEKTKLKNEDLDFGNLDFTDEDDEEIGSSKLEIGEKINKDAWDFGNEDVKKKITDNDTEIKIEDIPGFETEQKKAEDSPEPVPFKPETVESKWMEEPLEDEEPMFYEEPV